MPTYGRARLATLLAIVVLAAACAGTASPNASGLGSPSASGPVPQWEPRTAWERALVTINPDTGTFAKEDALRLFATAFGPIPGVDVPQDLTGVTDRTIAISAVMAYESELTAEQRAAIDAAIAPPPGAVRIEVPAEAGAAQIASGARGLVEPVLALARSNGGIGVSRPMQAEVTPQFKQAIRDAAERIRADIAGRINENFDGKITIDFVAQPKDQPNLLGQAWSNWPGGVFGDCQITIFAEAANEEPLGLLDTLSHEIFHCFQFNGYHFMALYATAPQWVIEGQAEWVGGDLTGGLSGDSVNHWRRYLLMPWLPLTGFTYEAIGFYSHLKETGTDPWTRFRAMWAAGSDSVAAFRNSDAENPIFLESWASGFLREPERGTAWDTIGPGITDDKYHPYTEGALVPGAVFSLSRAMLTNDLYPFEAKTDLVRIQVTGPARLSDGTFETTQLDGVTFCVSGHDCAKKCPDGSDPPKTQGTIGTRFVLALSGGLTGAMATVEGMDIDDETCSPPPSAEPTDDEFCRRYRDYVAWAEALGPDTDVTQEIARQIATRFEGMEPVAPAELRDEVVLVFAIYATFGNVPEPWNVPGAGHIAGPTGMARLPGALQAMHAHCGIPWPGG
jgi:hypothetical protein